MGLSGKNRWGLALADLSLLMLGFMVLQKIHPREESQIQNYKMQAEQVILSTNDLFEPGEAMLSTIGQKHIQDAASNINGNQYSVTIDAHGFSQASSRLDGWELSAARMASFARGLEKAGVANSRLSFGSNSNDEPNAPQKIVLTYSLLK